MKKVVKLNGLTLELYPLSKLVEDLNATTKQERTAQTIRKWEQKKIIPSVAFRIKGRRFYHQKQIDTVCRIAREENIRQGRDFSQSKFVERVWEELPKVTSEVRGEAIR